MAFNSKRTACYIHMKRGSHGPYMSFSVHVWHVSGGHPLPHPPNPSSAHPFAEPNTETKRIQQFSFFVSRCANTQSNPSPG